MKHIFIFGVLGLYTLIAFQPPRGFSHPLMAVLQGLDSAWGVKIQVDTTEKEVSSLDSLLEQ